MSNQTLKSSKLFKDVDRALRSPDNESFSCRISGESKNFNDWLKREISMAIATEASSETGLGKKKRIKKKMLDYVLEDRSGIPVGTLSTVDRVKMSVLAKKKPKPCKSDKQKDKDRTIYMKRLASRKLEAVEMQMGRSPCDSGEGRRVLDSLIEMYKIARVDFSQHDIDLFDRALPLTRNFDEAVFFREPAYQYDCYIMTVFYLMTAFGMRATPLPKLVTKQIGFSSLSIPIGLDETTRNYMTEIMSTLESAATGVSSKMEELIDCVKDVGSNGLTHNLNVNISDEKKKVLRIILMMIGTYQVISGVMSGSLLSPIIGVVSLLTSTIGCWDQWNTFFEKAKLYFASGVVPQSGFSISKLVRAAMVFLFGVTFKDLECKNVNGLIKDFSKTSKLLKECESGLNFTMTFFMNLIEDFVNFVRSYMDKPPIDLVDHPDWELKALARKLGEMQSIYLKDPYQDTVFASDLEQLDAELLKERDKLSKNAANNKPSLDRIDMLRRDLFKMKSDLATKHVTCNGQRAEPLLINFVGPAGVGKTVFVNSLWPRVTAKVLDENDVERYSRNRGDFIHLFNQNDQYYSGYTGQFNMLVDEFGLLRDTPGVGSVFAELIQWVNCNPYNLNQAALNDKGRAFFRSKFVWCTSNRQHFGNLTSIVEPSAVHRRLQFGFVVTPKREFCTDLTAGLGPWERKLDKGKLNGDYKDFSFLDFHPIIDPGTGSFDEVPIGCDQVEKLIIGRYLDLKDSSNKFLDAVNDTVDSIIKERLRSINHVEPQIGNSGEACHCPGCDPSCVYSDGVNIERFLLSTGLFKLSETGSYYYDGEFGVSLNTLIPLIEDKGSVFKLHILGAKCVKYAQNLDEFLSLLIYQAMLNQEKREKEDSYKNNFWVQWFANAAVFTISYTVVRAICSGVSALCNWFSPKVEAQTVYNMRKTFKGSTRRAKLLTQSGDDPGTYQQAISLVRKNMYRFSLDDDNYSESKGNVFVVHNEMVLMPRHYADLWVTVLAGDGEDRPPNRDCKITFVGVHYLAGDKLVNRTFTMYLRDLFEGGFDNDTGEWEYSARATSLGTDGDEDMVLYYIPGLTGKNVLDRFVKSSDNVREYGTGVLGLINQFSSEVYHSANYKLSGSLRYYNNEYLVPKTCIYNVPTRGGDCGAIFLRCDKSAKQKIVSIHVAGMGTNKGIGFVIYHEQLSKAFDVMTMLYGTSKDKGPSVAHDAIKHLVLEEDCEESILQMTNLTSESKLKKVPLASVSRIVPSPILAKVADYVPKKIPAAMRPFETDSGLVINPMTCAMAGYGVSSVSPCCKLLLAATESYGKLFFSQVDKIFPDQRRVVSFEEAVAGIAGDDCAGPISRVTSPGWPFKHILKGKGKQEAFGIDEFTFDSPMALLVKKVVDHNEDLCRRNIRPFNVNVHFLKDELRKIDRVKEGKTRLISSSDIASTILIRKYTLEFTSYCMRSKIYNGMAIGVNPYSDDWSAIALHLRANSKGVRVIAGDFSGYDKTLNPVVMRCMIGLMNDFYGDCGEEASNIRKVLIDDLTMSRHLIGEHVYSWSGSNPSGNPLTTILNSICNNILIRMAIYLIYFDTSDCPVSHLIDVMDSFNSFVTILAYGDDNLISIDDTVESIFDSRLITQQALTDAFLKLGMHYTDDSKGTVFVENRSLGDVTFLKRHFYRTHINKSRYMAALDLDTILNSIMWMKRTDVDFADWKKNVAIMIKELSAHPKHVFDEWAPAIAKASLGLTERIDESLFPYYEGEKSYDSTMNVEGLMRSYRSLQEEFVSTPMEF